MKTNVKLGLTYKTRNGFKAKVTAIDCQGIRPVAATIIGDGGVYYTRYYTPRGYEISDPAAPRQPTSPYDLVAKA